MKSRKEGWKREENKDERKEKRNRLECMNKRMKLNKEKWMKTKDSENEKRKKEQIKRIPRPSPLPSITPLRSSGGCLGTPPLKGGWL